MSIEEEIKILENALSGALLVPSECAFVSTEIIKICLETLKTYESWELLIRHEIEKQIRADAIEKFEKTKTDVLKWLIKRQEEGYGTSNGELLDHIYDIAEQLKSQDSME